MAIDPNIAMGIRPVQVENPMNQLAQLLQLRQLQQGYEGQNALSEAYQRAYAGGGEPNSAAILQNLAQSGQGHLIPKVQEQLAKTAKEKADLQSTLFKTSNDRAIAMSGGYKWLADNPTLENAKLLTDSWAANGLVPPEMSQKLYAQFASDPSRIAANANQAATSAISAKDQATLAETARGHNLTYGAAMYGHNVAHEGHRMTDTRLREQLHPIETGEGPGVYQQYGPNAGVIRPMTQAPWSPPGTSAPQVTPPTVVGGGGNSAFITTQQPQQPVTLNNLANQQAAPAQQPQAGAAYTRATPKISGPTLTEVIDPTDPKRILKVDARVYKQGTGPGSPGVLGTSSVKELDPTHLEKLRQDVTSSYTVARDSINTANDISKNITALRENPSGLKNASGWNAYIMSSPDGKASQAENDIADLKGKVQAMARTAANAGGKIGPMATQEWGIVERQLANLDPKKGYQVFKREMDKIEEHVSRLASQMEDTYAKSTDVILKDYPQFESFRTLPKYEAPGKGALTSNQPGVIEFSSMRK